MSICKSRRSEEKASRETRHNRNVQLLKNELGPFIRVSPPSVRRLAFETIRWKVYAALRRLKGCLYLLLRQKEWEESLCNTVDDSVLPVIQLHLPNLSYYVVVVGLALLAKIEFQLDYLHFVVVCVESGYVLCWVYFYQGLKNSRGTVISKVKFREGEWTMILVVEGTNLPIARNYVRRVQESCWNAVINFSLIFNIFSNTLINFHDFA